jgi:hypothetical protein
MVEDVGVSNDEPGERSRVLFGVGARVGFDSGVTRWRTIED